MYIDIRDISKSEPIPPKINRDRHWYNVRQRVNFRQHFIPNFWNLANKGVDSMAIISVNEGCLYIGAISSSGPT